MPKRKILAEALFRPRLWYHLSVGLYIPVMRLKIVVLFSLFGLRSDFDLAFRFIAVIITVDCTQTAELRDSFSLLANAMDTLFPLLRHKVTLQQK
ncbi:MAG: hypothetical protein SRB2_03242 [Desulfobacteraceae bacterium Eth-SRB2]|nr:MAG: hypothetical protein SRB2_03242 [Desulfobacteraceae bacterium Eth-SRB2]